MSSLIAFVIALDTKLIILTSSLIGPIVFIVLHFLAERSIYKRREADKSEQTAQKFENKMDMFLLAASKLTYKDLDVSESEEIIEDIKIDAYAKYRAVRRFWKKNAKELGIPSKDMDILAEKVNAYLYFIETKKEWRKHYSGHVEGEKNLLELCGDIVDFAHNIVE